MTEVSAAEVSAAEVRELTELITPGQAKALAGLLGAPRPDAALPLLWHWVYLLVYEPRHEDRAAIEVRYGVIGRQALRGTVLPLQESQDRGVALDTGTRPGGGERAGDPRAAVIAVDAEHVGLVHTELRRRDRVTP